MPAAAGRHGNHAASDDGSGTTAAIAANSSLAAATVRETYAEVAPPRANGAENASADGAANGSGLLSQSGKGNDEKIPPGEGPLPSNPGEFVEEIHSRIDLFEIWQSLLKSEDHKIRQRAVEKLTEMRYKGVSALEDEQQPVFIDIDGIVGTQAAQGATR